jgi:hypothetical protein
VANRKYATIEQAGTAGGVTKLVALSPVPLAQTILIVVEPLDSRETWQWLPGKGCVLRDQSMAQE